MRIDFNEPYSIKELVQSYNKVAKEEIGGGGSSTAVEAVSGNGNAGYKPSSRILKHNQSTSSLYGTDVVCEEHRNLIDSISRQVVYDCAAATSVMSTNALAFLLLTRHRQGSTAKQLAKDLDELRKTLKGQKDLGFSGEAMHIINYATDLLGEDLVKRSKNPPKSQDELASDCADKNKGEDDQAEEENIGYSDDDDDEMSSCYIQVADKIESWIEMAYYAHTLTPHFALQSILMTTFQNMWQKESQNFSPPSSVEDEEDDNDNDLEWNNLSQSNINKGPFVLRSKLLECALENCEIYRYEYILHKPTQTLEYMLDVTMDELIDHGFIKERRKVLDFLSFFTIQVNHNHYPHNFLHILFFFIFKMVGRGGCTRIRRNHQIKTNHPVGAEKVLQEYQVFDNEDAKCNGNMEDGECLYYIPDNQGDQRAMCEVLAPCAYTYHCVAQSLYILYRNSMLESEFIRHVIKDIKQRVETGECPYGKLH